MIKKLIASLSGFRCLFIFSTSIFSILIFAQENLEAFPVETNSALWKVSTGSPESVVNSFFGLFEDEKYMDAYYAFDPSTRRVMASQVLSGGWSNWVSGEEAVAVVRPYLLSKDINLMDAAILFDQLMGVAREFDEVVFEIKDVKISSSDVSIGDDDFSKVALSEGWYCLVRRNKWLGWRIVGFSKSGEKDWPVSISEIPGLIRGENY